MSLKDFAKQVALEFAEAYGRPPQWVAAAPGRVNLIGEHTDYNDGYVFPMAIDRYCVIAGSAAKEANRVELRSVSGAEPAVIDLSKPLEPAAKGSWFNYPLGVIAGAKNRGVSTPGFDALIHSTVPLGGGLSSSAALEVSMATLLEAMSGKKFKPVDKALLSQEAEHKFAGVPCGIMDQFISVMGKKDHLLLLDCRACKPEQVPMKDKSVAVLITNSNVKHELTGGGYAKRREQCEAAARLLGVKALRDADAALVERDKAKLDEVVYRRARHVVSEIERTLHAAEGVRASNWTTVGQLMYASHSSLKNDYEVSCAELDVLVDIASELGLQNGVYGARMTGGGFGGCTVTLVEADKVASISERLAAEYEKRTKIKPTLFVSRPAAGASIVKL